MRAGDLAVDAMAIGCLDVDRRGRRFFVLSHFPLDFMERPRLSLNRLMGPVDDSVTTDTESQSHKVTVSKETNREKARGSGATREERQEIRSKK